MTFIQKNKDKFIQKEPGVQPWFLEDIVLPPAGEMITELEQEYSLELPEDFKEFLLHLENHTVNPDGYAVLVSEKANKNIEVNDFYSLVPLSEKLENDLFQLIPYSYPGDEEAIDAGGKVPGWNPQKKNDYMTIAFVNANNDHLLLGISEDKLGKIYLWKSSNSEKRNPIEVFDSTEDMINSLSFK